MSNSPFELNKRYSYTDYTENRWYPEANSNVAKTSYHNYFFSGNDITVGIVPFYMKDKIIPIPVTDMAFGISQEKVPIYSAFSYTWDAVAKGTRIVRGEFSIVFSKPNHIGRLLGDPAMPDNPEILDSSSSPVVDVSGDSLLNEKEELRSKFWGNDQHQESSAILVDPTLAGWEGVSNAYPFGRQTPINAFEADYSGHQPFDIIIMMGQTAQTRQTSNNGFDGYGSWSEGIIEDNKYYGSYNDAVNQRSEKIILKNIELMSCGIGLDPSGQPLRESYSFIARDAIVGV